MALNSFHDVTQVVKMIVGAVAVVAGDMVVLSAGTVVPAADSCITGIFGIAFEGGATGEWIAVARDGVFRFNAAAGVNFAPGALAYVATVTTLDAGSMTDISVGVVVDYDPASAGAVALQITPIGFKVTTTHA